jgi:hypothetical protein
MLTTAGYEHFPKAKVIKFHTGCFPKNETGKIIFRKK